MTCIATTSHGYQCINPAQPGSRVCASHDPRRQCGQPTRKGGKCRRMKAYGHDRCSKHL